MGENTDFRRAALTACPAESESMRKMMATATQAASATLSRRE
jgi:hypothetical protein